MVEGVDRGGAAPNMPNTVFPQGADPPLPLQYTYIGTAGKNYLNEEITPLLPTGIGERVIAKPYQIKDMQRSCADVNSTL
jgi:hypothetical protein